MWYIPVLYSRDGRMVHVIDCGDVSRLHSHMLGEGCVVLVLLVQRVLRGWMARRKSRVCGSLVVGCRGECADGARIRVVELLRLGMHVLTVAKKKKYRHVGILNRSSQQSLSYAALDNRALLSQTNGYYYAHAYSDQLNVLDVLQYATR